MSYGEGGIMRFKCNSCGETFVYAAKKIQHFGNLKEVTEKLKAGETAVTEDLETHVCPYCGEKDFEEYTQPSEEPVVEKHYYGEWEGNTTLINQLLEQGYVIQEKLSGTKTVVMYKYAEHGDYVEEAQAKAKEAKQE
jgi:predicted RNA-binding Zn-ribbon protein involved in translation (DUF1610 family)